MPLFALLTSRLRRNLLFFLYVDSHEHTVRTLIVHQKTLHSQFSLLLNSFECNALKLCVSSETYCFPYKGVDTIPIESCVRYLEHSES